MLRMFFCYSEKNNESEKENEIEKEKEKEKEKENEIEIEIEYEDECPAFWGTGCKRFFLFCFAKLSS